MTSKPSAYRIIASGAPIQRVAVLVLLGLCLASGALASRATAQAGPGSLAAWQELYGRWLFGTLPLPTDANGNATVHNVVLMPLPASPGDGTPGHLEVTLNAGQRWVLPLFLLPGTSYTDGTPPDPFVPVSLFETMDVSFKVDGVTMVDTGNVLDFFYRAMLAPAIPYDAPPIDAIIWFEGLGLPVQNPFPPGVHTLQLDLRNTEPLPAYFGGGFAEYHNTWTVTVLPGGNTAN